MIGNIIGFENRTYTNKETGELVECLQLHYSRPFKKENEKGFGSSAESVFVSGSKFPEAYSSILKAGASIIGKKVSISKDVSTFNGQTRAVLDELELL